MRERELGSGERRKGCVGEEAVWGIAKMVAKGVQDALGRVMREGDRYSLQQRNTRTLLE